MERNELLHMYAHMYVIECNLLLEMVFFVALCIIYITTYSSINEKFIRYRLKYSSNKNPLQKVNPKS